MEFAKLQRVVNLCFAQVLVGKVTTIVKCDRKTVYNVMRAYYNNKNAKRKSGSRVIQDHAVVLQTEACRILAQEDLTAIPPEPQCFGLWHLGQCGGQGLCHHLPECGCPEGLHGV